MEKIAEVNNENDFTIYLSSEFSSYCYKEIKLYFDYYKFQESEVTEEIKLTPDEFQGFIKWVYSKKGEYECKSFTADFVGQDKDEVKIRFDFAKGLFSGILTETREALSVTIPFSSFYFNFLKINLLKTAFIYSLEKNNVKQDNTFLVHSQWTMDELIGFALKNSTGNVQKTIEVFFPRDGYIYSDTTKKYPRQDERYEPYAAYLDLSKGSDLVYLHSYTSGFFSYWRGDKKFQKFIKKWNKKNSIRIEKECSSKYDCYFYSFISLTECVQKENIYDALYETIFVKTDEVISRGIKALTDGRFYFTKEMLDPYKLADKLMAIPKAFDAYNEGDDYIRVFVPCTSIEHQKKTHLLVQIYTDEVYLCNGHMKLWNATWKEKYPVTENLYDLIMQGITQHGYKLGY